MKTLHKTKWALYIALSLFVFTSCGDDGDDDPAPSSSTTPTPTSNVNKYNGSASYGDILDLEINTNQNSYTVNNLTTGVNTGGSYTELNAAVDISGTLYDVFEGIYEIDEGNNGNAFAIEIADRLLAGNFESGRAQNDIFLAVSDEQDYSNRLDEVVGNYFYVALEPGQQASGQNEWGMFSIEEDGDMWGFYSYKSPNDTVENYPNRPIRLPIDSLQEDSIDNTFYYAVSLQNGNELTFEDEDDNPVMGAIGYLYIGGESTAILLDQGTGNGAIYAFKIDDSQLGGNQNPSKYLGEYKYVDFYEGFDIDKGCGNYSVQNNPNATIDRELVFDRSLLGYNNNTNEYEVEINVQVVMEWTGFPGLYYSEDYDNSGSDLYTMFAGDFVMYFDYTSAGSFRGYGVGGKLD